MSETQSPTWSGFFARAAGRFANWTGTPQAFMLALAVVLIWAISGPFVGFSDFWQLTINTGTTIITFLMVFLIQNSQNRDTHALQIKIDELIRATKGASNSLLDLEALSDEEIETLHKRYHDIAVKAGKLEEVAKDAAEETAPDKARKRTSSRRTARANGQAAPAKATH